MFHKNNWLTVKIDYTPKMKTSWKMFVYTLKTYLMVRTKRGLMATHVWNLSSKIYCLNVSRNSNRHAKIEEKRLI